MHTCSDNFSHIIVEHQPKDHKLVTHGVYSVLRHPSYVGWFYFAIGTQIVLANPISFVAYVVATWKFFADRYLPAYGVHSIVCNVYLEFPMRKPYLCETTVNATSHTLAARLSAFR